MNWHFHFFIVMTEEEFQWFCKEFNYTCIVYVIVVLLYLYSMFSDVFALVSVIYVCIVGSPEGGCHSASASVFAKDQWHHLYKIKFVLVLYSNSYFHLIILCISVSICICIVMSQEECVMSESGVGSAENSESIWHTLHFDET